MEAVAELASLMAERGRTDIRLEAAIAKMWNTEAGWRIVDDTLQIRGGRGYETADSLAGRGERPDPVERMMRDFRINLIFEGSSEIMRLFIAREAVDTHFKVACALIDPKTPLGQKSPALAAIRRCSTPPGTRRAGSACAARLGYGEFGPLATHLRFVRARQPQARPHALPLHGALRPEAGEAAGGALPAVDIGAELFAMTAACSRGAGDGARGPGEPRAGRAGRPLLPPGPPPRRGAFDAVFDNDDVPTYAVAQQVSGTSTPGWNRAWCGWRTSGSPAIFQATSTRAADADRRRQDDSPSPGPKRSTSPCSRPSSTPGPDQEIVTETREFSPVCPYSGLPDFATLRIVYVPSDRCIELKSLKYYVTSYRSVGIFQEHATAKIAEDLFGVLGRSGSR